MTLQASGQIDASDINVELGRSATATLGLGSDAGVRALAAVGSVGTQIRLGADFYSKSYLTLVNPTPSLTSTHDAVGSANAGFTINTSGVLASLASGSGGGAGVSSGTASSAYIYVTNTSGSTVTSGSDSLNTWLSLSSLRTFNFVRSGVGVRTGTFAIYFAKDASGTGQTTPGTITCTATVE
jgi:hypothetical protein